MPEATLSISVARATFNGARHLRPQLKSIADQSCQPIELVVCDDGSSDDTLRILADFSAHAPFPVSVFPNASRLGFRSNFMQCARLCRGDLIAFCDQDDVWHPNKLQKQRGDFSDPSIMLSCHNAELINVSGERIGGRLDQYRKSSCLDFLTAGPGHFPRGFTQIIRKMLVKWDWLRQGLIDVHDSSEVISHDGWFYLMALLHGKAVYHHKPLADHRQHGRNASGRVVSKRRRFLSRFQIRPNEFRRLAGVWQNRRKMLCELISNEKDIDTEVAFRITQLICMYGHFEDATAARGEYYAACSPLARLHILRQAILRREFRRNDPWAFPVEAALRDAVYLFSRPFA